MDFDFSDDQEQLRDAVRKWVDKGYTFERRRAAVAAGGFDRAAWSELAELGLTALTVPEAHDGMGQGAIDAMVVAEELGRGMVLEPIAQAFMASSVLSHYAPADVQARLAAPRGQRRSPGGAGPAGAQGTLPPGCLRGKSGPSARWICADSYQKRSGCR